MVQKPEKTEDKTLQEAEPNKKPLTIDEADAIMRAWRALPPEWLLCELPEPFQAAVARNLVLVLAHADVFRACDWRGDIYAQKLLKARREGSGNLIERLHQAFNL